MKIIRAVTMKPVSSKKRNQEDAGLILMNISTQPGRYCSDHATCWEPKRNIPFSIACGGVLQSSAGIGCWANDCLTKPLDISPISGIGSKSLPEPLFGQTFFSKKIIALNAVILRMFYFPWKKFSHRGERHSQDR